MVNLNAFVASIRNLETEQKFESCTMEIDGSYAECQSSTDRSKNS